ncbi:MAG: hypothetical protein CVV41_01950 [Candidatus Riflebacteria bacterium HGW-Riflebacteria-1]|jgi:hypothetical protein|nr:MAG: hypothetical protein CVV41_01950 [Candidatus Riflebacteria bacterium HGW-Riflebacteria-1]
MEFFIKLKNLDRRWVFLFVAASVVLPMLLKFDFPVFPGKSVTNLHNFVDALPEGTRCFLSFDYDPASEPELGPSAIAILTHMFRKGHRPLCGGNWPLGGEMAEGSLAKAVEIYTATYDEMKAAGKLAPGCKKTLVKGEDYVNLGYKPGAIIHVKALVTDFMGPYPSDRDGNSTKEMGIFKNPDGRKFAMSDVGIIVSFTAGTGGIESFINVAGDHKRPMAAGCTSVNIPRFITYLQTGQLVGMTGGLPGAAEYEKLIDHMGKGREGMAPQSIAHLVIMLFIIIGNIAYIAEQRIAKNKKA